MRYLRVGLFLGAIPVFAVSVIVSSGQNPEGLGTSPQINSSFGQVIAGELTADSHFFTTIQVTNRALMECGMDLLFHLGAGLSETVPRINGEETPQFSAQIPRGGVVMFTLTATQLLQGSATIFVSPPCMPDSLSAQATYFIVDPNQPTSAIREAFTIRPNDFDSWLRDDRCLAFSTSQGILMEGVIQDLGIATSGVNPANPAPEGTFLEFSLFDSAGNFQSSTSRDISGQHSTILFSQLFPESLGKFTTVTCMTSSNPSYLLDLTLVRVNQRGEDFQFDGAIFADGFESGDVSAWSSVVP